MNKMKENATQIVVVIVLFCTLIISINRSSWSLENLCNSLSKDKENLSKIARNFPPEVSNMKEILQRNLIKEFKLSPDLNKNGLIVQRSAEYLYPSLINQNSINIFSKKNSTDYKDCKLIDKEKEILLYEC
tara:strand:+ start:104 stop:496 length:393 start_codon:yes stop_codon:yes gene_type:complete